MSTDLEIVIKKGADYPEPLLNNDDVKDLYSLLGEYYPEVARISYQQGMDIFTPFVADQDISKRKMWTVNLKIVHGGAIPPTGGGLWETFPDLDLEGLPHHGLEESWGGSADENAGGIGSAIGVFGLPPLVQILPRPLAEKTPRPKSSIQLPAAPGDDQPPFELATSDREYSSAIMPARHTIDLPEVDDDTADFKSELAGSGEAAECIIGLAFALPSTIHLGGADLSQSNNNPGPSTLFEFNTKYQGGKQPERDIQSYDIGILLNVDLIYKELRFRSLFEDEESIEAMKTSWAMEAIYRMLFDLEGTVNFDDDLRIRVVAQRPTDATKRETCDSVISAFILAGFETPEESKEYELFNQTILAMRASAWKNHKDILWAGIKSSRFSHQAKVKAEEGKEVDNIIDEEVEIGKSAAADSKNGMINKGKGKAVDKGKGKAVDKGYEEAPPESLDLQELDNTLGLFG